MPASNQKVSNTIVSFLLAFYYDPRSRFVHRLQHKLINIVLHSALQPAINITKDVVVSQLINGFEKIINAQQESR